MPPSSSSTSSEPHPSTPRTAGATATTSSKALSGVEPTNHLLFDPWNSASTGHQRADGPSVAGTRWWRDVRTEKLGRQFRGDRHRGTRNGRDGKAGEWRWMSKDEFAEVKKRREEGWGDIRCFMGGVAKKRRVEDGKGKENHIPCSGKEKKKDSNDDDDDDDDDNDMDSNTNAKPIPSSTTDDNPGPFSIDSTKSAADENTEPDPNPATETRPTDPDEEPSTGNPPRDKGIFSNLTIYINGSTYPLISDHRLKHLLVSNGAEIALAPGRRKVTHVILGKHNRTVCGANGNGNSGSGSVREGCGGGLSALKLQREIERVGGRGSAGGVRFVGVEWVLESLKASKRLPESRFADRTLHMAPSGQPSVLGMFNNLNQKKRKKVDGS